MRILKEGSRQHKEDLTTHLNNAIRGLIRQVKLTKTTEFFIRSKMQINSECATLIPRFQKGSFITHFDWPDTNIDGNYKYQSPSIKPAN